MTDKSMENFATATVIESNGDYVGSDIPKDYSVAESIESEPISLDSDVECKAHAISVGMTYPSAEDIEQIYINYAKCEGFGIRRRNTRKTVVQWVCHREGMHKSKRKVEEVDNGRHSTSCRASQSHRVGCRAGLNCCKDSNRNIWRITKFYDNHNHGMISPNSKKYLRCHKNMSITAKGMTRIFDSQGISVSKVVDVMYPNPQEAEFSRKDCYNHITSLRKQIIDVGDAQTTYMWCTRQKEINSDFQFSIQLDSDGRMLNLFWVDARSRTAYECFGEVVSFDTTYKTNKYSMPFAPFVGVDNHLHNILFGCALLLDETEETFIWLFNTWLHAMKGKHLVSFITDQDTTIMNAVKRVFPSTKQRLCLWHITKKFPERLSHIYSEKSKFKRMMHDCIHETYTVFDFEVQWENMIQEFQLQDNKWLKNLYSMRQLWIPVFGRHTFFGGLNTTGRSESINSFFDNFVHSRTTLQEFVIKYNQALQVRYETLRRSEYDSNHKNPTLTLNMDLEEHAAKIYTHEIFLKFHKELSSMVSCHPQLEFEDQHLRTYRVRSRNERENGVLVEYNVTTNDAQCQCMLFEFIGFLCRHIICVFYVHGVRQIPEKYILQRWSKTAALRILECPIAIQLQAPSSVHAIHLKSAFEEFTRLCDKSDIIAEFIRSKVDEILATARNKLDDIVEQRIVGSPTNKITYSEQCNSQIILDPMVTQTKGRRKSSKCDGKRIRSGIEIAKDNHVRCSNCKGIGHNRHTCGSKEIKTE